MAKTELFENPDKTTVMRACNLACLGPRQRFSVDGKHFIRFRGENATGLAWTQNILYVFKSIRISVDGAWVG